MQDVATRLAMIALVATIAGCSIIPTPSPPSPGQADRERLVGDYLAALERRDSGAVAAMVSPGVDATADIAAAMDQSSGVRLHEVRASYRDEFGGIYAATVTGTGDDGTPTKSSSRSHVSRATITSRSVRLLHRDPRPTRRAP